jgi:hypothetical protein
MKYILIFIATIISVSGFTQTSKLNFNHSIKTYDSLSYDNSIRLLENTPQFYSDTTLFVPQLNNFFWYGYYQPYIRLNNGANIEMAICGKGQLGNGISALGGFPKRDTIGNYIYHSPILFNIKTDSIVEVEFKNFRSANSNLDSISIKYSFFTQGDSLKVQFGNNKIKDWNKLYGDLDTIYVDSPVASFSFNGSCINHMENNIWLVNYDNGIYTDTTLTLNEIFLNMNIGDNYKFVDRIPNGTVFTFTENKEYVSVKEEATNTINVYPNPTLNGVVTLLGITEADEIKVVECSSGRRIPFVKYDNKIELNTNKSGLYILSVINQKGVFRKKIMVIGNE